VVSSSGVVTDFQIHARIAVLDKNFSPADNRNIPPLQYDLVYQLVQDFPHLSFSLNGGVESLQSAQNHLNTCQGLKGVMV
jgi:tRNA-dihydrouridine synthase A